MKKIFFVIIAALAVVIGLSQTATPRYGTGKNYSPRTLNYGYATVTDASGNDTITVTPNAFETLYKCAGTDSVSVSFTATKAYYGDKVTIVLSNASGVKKLKLIGSSVPASTGTVTTNSGKGAVVTLVFDGSNFIETGRTLQ